MDPPTARTPPRPPSPALGRVAATPTPAASGPGSPSSAAPAAPGTPGALQLDMSLSSAVAALVHHLVAPLAPHYAHSQLMGLRSYLTAAFSKAFAPTWKENNPHHGSGTRSLIADHIHGLPLILKEAAEAKEIGTAKWRSAIATLRKKKMPDDESDIWEVWCDPGMVVWRWGGWGWDEIEFDPVKCRRESFQVIWQATPNVTSPAAETTSPSAVAVATSTPVRSKAIPIRAPALIPPTPSPAPSAASVSSAPPAAPAPTASAAPTAHVAPHSPSPVYATEFRAPSTVTDRRTHNRTASARSGPGHKGQESTSSTASDSSDTGSQQLLTPASRPGSADLFPDDSDVVRGREREPSPARTATNEPTVTPYDGGNVTVLGGGTKLGGSRPSSVMSHRTRSPSVSVASRALGTAVGTNANGGALRKQRSRAPRRIAPAYLGPFSQPGIGGPISSAFTPPLKHQPGMPFWPQGQPGAPGVGVGVAPPPVGGMGLANQMGMAHAMNKRI